MPKSDRAAMEPDDQARFAFAGEVGRRLQAVTRQWILSAPAANPAMLEMLRDRDRRPWRDLVPWAGEFAGKYVTHAVQVGRVTGDPVLHDHLARFVRDWLSLQADDGYLGPWPESGRLTNRVAHANGRPHDTWDTWGHYHAMLGLLLWHRESGDVAALTGATRMADLLCRRYLGAASSPPLAATGSTEMNLAPIHSLCLLYRYRPEPRYLELARQIAEVEFSRRDEQGAFLAGNYLEAALAGQPFWEQPKPRWESLHPIQGLAELHLLTGEPRYRQAFEALWRTMRLGDRHNNGGFTSGERATGDPCQPGAIETCCTVAWMAMTVDMLRLTGDPRAADELEVSLLNSGLGLIAPSGRWVTYDTPMDGVRRASAHSIVFQAREGASELNCCAVNGPRVLGLLGEWALMRGAGRGLYLNYYGPGTLETTVGRATRFVIEQETDYPREARVLLRVTPSRPCRCRLHLRLPGWSAQTRLLVNGELQPAATAGTYHPLDRVWRRGDRIELELDFRTRVWSHSPWPGPCRDWEARWRLLGTPPVTPTALLAGETPPEPAADAPLATSHLGCLDLGILLGRQSPAAWLFTDLDSPTDCRLPVVFAINWLCAWYLNGKLIHAGDGAAFDGLVNLRLCHLELPLRAGRNRLAIRVLVHSNHPHWLASLGIGLPRPGNAPPAARFASLYRGPLLLAIDTRYNPGLAIDNLPILDASQLAMDRLPPPDLPLPPWLLAAATAADGSEVRLCDFASAGAAGTVYRSWLPVSGVEPVPFSDENPWRTQTLA